MVTLERNMRTPWGAAQHVTQIADGILSVSTAGHGGIKLDRQRNAGIPEYMRADGGWYEEDCDWSIPGVVYSAAFELHSEGSAESARQTMMNWKPDLFARFFDVPVESLAGKSYMYDQRLFTERHAGDLVATAAWGDWHNKVPRGMVGIVATLGGNRTAGAAESWFLVPSADYDSRDHFGFVVPNNATPWLDHA